MENQKIFLERTQISLTEQQKEKYRLELDEIIDHRIELLLIRYSEMLFKIKDCIEGKDEKNYDMESIKKRKDFESYCMVASASMLWEILDSYVRRFGGYDGAITQIHNAHQFITGYNLTLKPLFELIKFDKTWICQKWVRNVIIEHQRADDQEFFQNLSDSIKLKKKNRISIKGEVEKRVIVLLDNLMSMRYIVRFENNFQLIDAVWKLLPPLIDALDLNESECDQLSGIHLINDRNYFNLFIKRKYNAEMEITRNMKWVDIHDKNMISYEKFKKFMLLT